jgi:hypothetical protein
MDRRRRKMNDREECVSILKVTTVLREHRMKEQVNEYKQWESK